MLYFWIILLILLNALWLALVLFALPGNWLIVITTALFAWWRADDGIFSIYTLVVIAVLAFLGELFEFFAAAAGARKAGAGLRGALGAVIGAVTGAVLGTFLIPVPLFDTLLGASIGAGLGAWLFELSAGRQARDSLRFAFGAGLGRFLGSTIKVAIGLLIWLTVAIAAFCP